MSSNNNILIFSPTGSVASTAALTASSLGATVHLAMRDPARALPAPLSALNLPRHQADLLSPASVLAAATASHAKTAFLYLAFGAPDHMRGAAEALKKGGVEFVVFLSSSSVKGDPAAVGMADFIAWQHAMVEVVLRDVFGKGGYVAVRPGYFASNLLGWWGEGRAVVKMPYPEARFDFVAPGDIGRVCGGLAVRGETEGGEEVVVLAGPQLISQGEAVAVVGRVVGREVVAEGFAEGEEEAAVQLVVERLGMPEAGARVLINGFKAIAGGVEVFEKEEYAVAVANIEKYGGTKATGIQEWAEENKDKFVKV